MLYYVGDFLYCHVSYDDSVIFDINYYNPQYQKFPTTSFEVIAVTTSNYVLLVPMDVEGNFNLSEARITHLGIDPKHLDHWGFLLSEEAVGGRVQIDYYSLALPCLVCKNYVPYAEPNQEDGRFACWSCKTDERYKVIYQIR